MATTFSKGLVQLRGNIASTMASSNPVLLNRELAVETDTGRAKIGDGVTAWNSLPYIDQNINFSPVGMLSPYGGTSAPSGWLLCDGSAVSRTTYSDLFGVIGTTYGVGDGSTTFNLPDMRAAVPVGAGTSTQFSQNETKTLGQAYDDKFQAWQLGIAEKATGGPVYYGSNRADNNIINGGSGTGHGLLQMKNDQQGVPTKATAYSDGTNGDPRTGDSTHGKQVAVNYIIKV
jgi:microcystin-dependent protein